MSTVQEELSAEMKKQLQSSDHLQVFSLKNTSGLVAQIANYGLRIVSLCVPDRNGYLEDIVLGFSNISDYQTPDGEYLGCVIGPFANRIENASFELNGKKIELEKNEGNHHLHGGSNGLHQVYWKNIFQQENKCTFYHKTTHDETGYPGTVEITVDYELTDQNELKIEYSAQCNTESILSLTNHSYFNLNGEGKDDILDHFIQIQSDKYLSVNEDLIPLEFKEVHNTPFDLRSKKRIRKGMESNHEQICIAQGYDHCFQLKSKNDPTLNLAAMVEEEDSGRILKVFTTEPGVQLYTGNFLDGSQIGKSGKPYHKNSGFCLETQQIPNSPNRSDFPSPIIRPKSTYSSKTIYQFLVKK